jgi:uncharacterized protein YutD
MLKQHLIDAEDGVTVMGLFHIGGKSYELLHENRSGWNAEAFRDRYSEVLERYDFIVGDWGYNQLRLKGFFRDNHQKANKDSSYSTMSDYINEYCNFGCAYFVLEKMHGVKYEPEVDELEPSADLPRLEGADLRAALQASLTEPQGEESDAEDAVGSDGPAYERSGRKPRGDYRHGNGNRRGEDSRKGNHNAQQDDNRSGGDKRGDGKGTKREGRDSHPRSEHRASNNGGGRKGGEQRSRKPFRLAASEAAASLADDNGTAKKDTEGS